MVTIQIRGFFHVFYHRFFPRNEVPLCSANLALRFHADPKADEKTLKNMLASAVSTMHGLKLF
jgi:hypothetical protein